jgi:hypothetical protein
MEILLKKLISFDYSLSQSSQKAIESLNNVTTIENSVLSN